MPDRWEYPWYAAWDLAFPCLPLALPKEGLRAPGAAPLVGELYLVDISVLPSRYGGPALGLEAGPIFAAGDVVRL